MKLVKECPYCGAYSKKDSQKCDWCSRDITNIEAIEVNSIELTGSKVAIFVSCTVGIIGAISGVVLGDIFKATTSHYNEILEEIVYDEVFNYGLMISTWLATAVIVLALVLCCFHFKNQENMLANQEKTNKLLDEIANK